MPKIFYNFASRSRPVKLIKCIENIIELSETADYIILIKMDVDDVVCANKEFNEKLLSYGSKVIPVYGFSKNKVDAINRDIWMVKDWDILINMSDDMIFLVKGFDRQILSDMDYLQKGTDVFLHYPDGSPAADILCTMSIMGKEYYDRFGYVYHHEFANVYCDNEATAVARILGKYKFINTQLFSHEHPAWGKCETDEQYLRTESKEGYALDHATFLRRQKQNFDL